MPPTLTSAPPLPRATSTSPPPLPATESPSSTSVRLRLMPMLRLTTAGTTAATDTDTPPTATDTVLTATATPPTATVASATTTKLLLDPFTTLCYPNQKLLTVVRREFWILTHFQCKTLGEVGST